MAEKAGEYDEAIRQYLEAGLTHEARQLGERNRLYEHTVEQLRWHAKYREAAEVAEGAHMFEVAIDLYESASRHGKNDYECVDALDRAASLAESIGLRKRALDLYGDASRLSMYRKLDGTAWLIVRLMQQRAKDLKSIQ